MEIFNKRCCLFCYLKDSKRSLWQTVSNIYIAANEILRIIFWCQLSFTGTLAIKDGQVIKYFIQDTLISDKGSPMCLSNIVLAYISLQGPRSWMPSRVFYIISGMLKLCLVLLENQFSADFVLYGLISFSLNQITSTPIMYILILRQDHLHSRLCDLNSPVGCAN